MRKNKASQQARSRKFKPEGAIAAIVSLVVVFSSAVYGVQALKRLDHFKVKEVFIREGNSARPDRNKDFSYFLGKNIFALDLKKNAQFIKTMYPAYRTARLVRFLPDKLCVDLMKRTAVASVGSQPAIYLDDNLIFFESADLAGGKPLPMITGIDKERSKFRLGQRCSSPGILFAVKVLQHVRDERSLDGYSIDRVQVHDSSNVSLYFPSQLEVKLGHEKLKDSLRILASLLTQVGNGVSNIEYIDLRFKDPVIRFKGKEA